MSNKIFDAFRATLGSIKGKPIQPPAPPASPTARDQAKPDKEQPVESKKPAP